MWGLDYKESWTLKNWCFWTMVLQKTRESHGLQPTRLLSSMGVSRQEYWSGVPLFKLMLTKSVMPSSHLILCHPLLLLRAVFPSLRVFSNELALCMRWPKHWSFSFNISPSSEYSGLISFRKSFRTGWVSLQSKGLSRVYSSTTVWKHQFIFFYVFLLTCNFILLVWLFTFHFPL